MATAPTAGPNGTTAQLIDLLQRSKASSLDNRQITGGGTINQNGVLYQEVFLQTPGSGQDDSVIFMDQQVIVPQNGQVTGVPDINGALHNFNFPGNLF